LISEFELIRRYFDRPPRHAELGIGDDAALLRPSAGAELAVSTDLLIEGRHFREGADARKVGHKSLAVNLSDLAAMGAAPRWATLALALPSADESWLESFAGGFFALAERYEVDLIGGDTTRGPLSICVTIFGEVPRGLALRRDGAADGDDIWVSGALGGAALALAQPANEAAARLLDEPEPRVELGERLRGIASAAIDVSDGFAQDLGHILERSKVAAQVEYERLPKFPDATADQVLSGGDDYELLFTSPASKRIEIESLARDLALAVSRVGTVHAGAPALRVLDREGRAMPARRGFDHFAA
jgi:thiamine-monophosphate kinase